MQRRIFKKGHFEKKYKRLPEYIRIDLNFKIDLLLKDPFHPLLHTHALHGRLTNFFAFYLRDGFRVLFDIRGDIILLHDVGSHNKYRRWERD